MKSGAVSFINQEMLSRSKIRMTMARTNPVFRALSCCSGGNFPARIEMKMTFQSVVIQILILDVVFSLDSVITAVGMADHLAVMVAAVVIAMGIMLWSAKSISDFVNRHPTLKMLALSFLILIGVMLVAEGFHQHIPKGYIYFAMAFAFMVEMLNLRLRAKAKAKQPVVLNQPYR